MLDVALQRADPGAQERFRAALENAGRGAIGSAPLSYEPDHDPTTTTGRSTPTVAICGSRAPLCDQQTLDETVAALARVIATHDVSVSHGPTGIGIEVMTYVADQFRPPGFTMTTARFGRENVIAGCSLVVVTGGGTGTAVEAEIARARGIPILPFAPTGGTAGRLHDELTTHDTGLAADLEQCTTAAQFAAFIELQIRSLK
jgi:hypothetical protein